MRIRSRNSFFSLKAQSLISLKTAIPARMCKACNTGWPNSAIIAIKPMAISAWQQPARFPLSKPKTGLQRMAGPILIHATCCIRRMPALRSIRPLLLRRVPRKHRNRQNAKATRYCCAETFQYAKILCKPRAHHNAKRLVEPRWRPRNACAGYPAAHNFPLAEHPADGERRFRLH